MRRSDGQDGGQGAVGAAMFWYFGYGSNMEMTSLRAKGVQPRHSTRAVAAGWRLRFNVQHFFRHEGGVGNIEPTDQQIGRASCRERVCNGV